MDACWRMAATVVIATAGVGLVWDVVGTPSRSGSAKGARVSIQQMATRTTFPVATPSDHPSLATEVAVRSTAVASTLTSPKTTTSPSQATQSTPSPSSSSTQPTTLGTEFTSPVTTSGQPKCGPEVHRGDLRCDGSMCGPYRTSMTKKPITVTDVAACCASCLADPACLTYMFMHGSSYCVHFDVAGTVLPHPKQGGHSIGFIENRVAPAIEATPASEPQTYGGLNHSDRCNQDGCTLLYPMPPPPTPLTIEELPVFPKTCMVPRAVPSPGTALEESYAPIAEGLSPGLAECRLLCAQTASCAAWTFAKPMLKGGKCTLHPAVEADPGVLGPSAAGSHCTTGLVRAGIARLAPGQRGWGLRSVSTRVPPLPPMPPASALRFSDIPIVRPGNCHRRSCLDVHHCAKRWPTDRKGKFALVVADDLHRPRIITRRGEHARNLLNSSEQAAIVAAARAHGVDVVMLLPNASAARHPLEEIERRHLESVGIKVSTMSPWIIPPNYRPQVNMGCTRQDLFRLNAFRLTEYDAVIVYDRDVSIFGDLTDVFRCAALNTFLTSSGPLSPLNLGFIAFKPNLGLLRAAELFVAESDYMMHDKKSRPLPNGAFAGGWDNIGFVPFGRHFIGGNCGQGLYWSLYYKNGERNTTRLLDRIWTEAGIERPPAYQLDRCIWDYQGDSSRSAYAECRDGFRCSDVRVLHKKIRPERDYEGGQGCFYYPRRPV